MTEDRDRPPRATKREFEEEVGYEPPLRPQPPPSGGRGGMTNLNLGGGVMQTIIVSIIVTAVLVFMVLPMAGGGGLVTKTDFTDNIAKIVNDLNQTKTTVQQGQATLNTAVQNLPATVNSAVGQTVSSLNQQISNLSSQVTTFNSSIQSNNDKVNQLTSKITTLEDTVKKQATAITDLQNKIVDLQTEQDTAANPNVAVTATVKTISNSLIATSNSTMSGSVRIELKNKTNVVVDDIVLEVDVVTPIIEGFQTCGLTGGGTIWQGQGIPYNMARFINTQWGLSLVASETKILYLTFTVTGTGFIPTYQVYGVPFQVDVEVQ